MLASVLLHMIKAAIPVDFAQRFRTQERFAEQMRYAILFVYDFRDRDSAQLAEIERLPTRGGIEGRAIEIDPLAVSAPVDDIRPKFGQITVVKIKSLGQSSIVIHLGWVAPRTLLANGFSDDLAGDHCILVK